MSANGITVAVKTKYLLQQSKPDEDQFAFAYHITIHNQSDSPTKLLGRHWIITDANEAKQEVRGAGVVGEQPLIAPGESYQYSSGVVLDTPIGTMQGSYKMRNDAGREFDAAIAPFLLSTPHAVN
ncbi:Co2+/Mg2+ efflux protein ApaG [Porticoccaceae bacterium]|jgi:ApaG protein|nr:Co2+/Mg2+ efflux protein ApaG [Porticoccaceae bacterium]MDG1494409.1 Co2+/Mg2+ efflux protein ApaG [Porticoccaceae bacterium]